ncbi:MAG: hypothetical protein RIR17_287 [Planctomycetota bacterium]
MPLLRTFRGTGALIMLTKLLGSSFASFLSLVPVCKLLLELLDAARSVNKFHLTCEEWVAIGTYFHHDVLLGATGYKLVTTTASNRCLGILGVNTILHVTFSIGWQR